MKKQILEILACPVCLPVEYGLVAEIEQVTHDDILEGRLICGHCRRVFPIEDGIAFLDPGVSGRDSRENRYETTPVVNSYLWGHYGDLMHDPEASDAYARWAELMEPHAGYCLDMGSAVGRFAFEMTRKNDFVIGLDNSTRFIQAARQLMRHRRVVVSILEEGLLTRESALQLPDEWNTGKVEFMVGDAQALPFKAGVFSSLASLNLVDKVPFPMKHLLEANRVAKRENAAFLLSDPFSWSSAASHEEEWLGGKATGRFRGRGMDNIIRILSGHGHMPGPPWKILERGHVWWKLRTHANHFELIRSCFVKAAR